MDARSVVSTEDDDRRSVASTVATTASLASRIQSLAVDFGPKVQEGIVEGSPEDEEEEESVEISEEQLLEELDRQEPAFQVCSRIFRDVPSSTTLRRLTLEQGESFRQKGYVVVDHFLTHEHAARIKAETTAFYRQGRLQEACGSVHPDRCTDRTARGDYIMWLHPGTSSTASPSFGALLTAFSELHDDLAQLVRLRLRACEHQLSYYPANGAQYVRHRDAFPDDGSEKEQRRVTAIVYANCGWRREDGGKLRMWPPCTGIASTAPNLVANGRAAPSWHADDNGNGLANGRIDLRPNGYYSHATQCPLHDTGTLEVHAGSNGLADDRAPQAHDGSCDCETETGGMGPRLLRHGSADSEGILPGTRSPKSLGSSVVAEPTEASSIPDNASVGSSAKSGGRSERIGNGRSAAVEVGAAAVVDVAPLPGRLVLFLSGAVEHAVLPNFADRVAVTCWCQ